jgi:hypothetical protein
MPKSPADQLKEWNQALAANQSQNADLAKDIDRLKNQIASLSKSVSDVDQKTQAWTKAVQASKDQQADLAAYVGTKLPILEAGLPNAKEVSGKKDAALKSLTDQQAALDAAAVAAAKKQQDWSTAKAAASDAANAYNSYANLTSANDAILKDLASLRASAEKDGAANNNARMYLQVLIMADQLKQLNLPTTADFATELNNRTSALAAADQAEKLAKIASDKAAADVSQGQKALDAARSSWRQNVLDSLPNGGAGAPPQAPAPPAQAAGPAPAPAPPVPPAAVAPQPPAPGPPAAAQAPVAAPQAPAPAQPAPAAPVPPAGVAPQPPAPGPPAAGEAPVAAPQPAQPYQQPAPEPAAAPPAQPPH